MTPPDPFPNAIHPVLAGVITSLSHRLVVVGSVARGKAQPKDIDLLFDVDSSRAEEEIRKAVRKADLAFDSVLPGQWTFCEYLYGVQVEILPVHRGPTYRVVAKRSVPGVVAGMPLRFARPEDATG